MTQALYETLDALEDGIQEMGHLSPEYWNKMIHKIPAATSVDRVSWLVNRLAGKTILHIGCVGPLHDQLLKVCKRAYGIDLEPASYPFYTQMDMDHLTGPLPLFAGVEVVLCAEVVEHLGNPRFLLEQLGEQYAECELIVTVPNAFSIAGQSWMKKGIENVNLDHVAWYSYWTLTALLTKSGYEMCEWYWAGGAPLTAEGIVMVCRVSEK